MSPPEVSNPLVEINKASFSRQISDAAAEPRYVDIADVCKAIGLQERLTRSRKLMDSLDRAFRSRNTMFTLSVIEGVIRESKGQIIERLLKLGGKAEVDRHQILKKSGIDTSIPAAPRTPAVSYATQVPVEEILLELSGTKLEEMGAVLRAVIADAHLAGQRHSERSSG